MKRAFIDLKGQFVRENGVHQLSIEFFNMEEDDNFLHFFIDGGGLSLVAKDAILTMHVEDVPDKV